MKKGKFLVLGLIALMLAGGLALASCGLGTDCDGSCGKTWDGPANLNGYCESGCSGRSSDCKC